MKVYAWQSAINPTLIVIAGSIREARRAVRDMAEAHPNLDVRAIRRQKPTIKLRLRAGQPLVFYTHTEEP